MCMCMHTYTTKHCILYCTDYRNRGRTGRKGLERDLFPLSLNPYMLLFLYYFLSAVSVRVLGGQKSESLLYKITWLLENRLMEVFPYRMKCVQQGYHVNKLSIREKSNLKDIIVISNLSPKKLPIYLS